MNIRPTQLQLSLTQFASFVIAVFAIVIGTIMALAPTASAEEAISSSAGRVTPSFLLIYSDKGTYKKAMIYSTGGESKCMGKKVGPEKPVSVSLTKAKNKSGAHVGVKVKCDPGSYSVYFLKKGEKLTAAKTGATQRYAATTLPSSACSFVHKKGVTRNATVIGDRCVGDDDPNEDTVEKFTPIMTAVTDPGQITQGKKYKMLVELKHPSGAPLSVEECAGSFVSNQPLAGGIIKNNKGEYPIRYNAKTKTCQYKQSVSSSKTKSMQQGSNAYSLTFRGNTFMNGAGSTYTENVLPGAATKAAAAKKEKAAKKKAGNTATAKAKITSATATKTQGNAVTLKVVVTGVEDCNRINPKIDAKVKKKSKKSNKQILGGESPQVTPEKVGDTCVLTSNISYLSMPKSDVSYKISFKAGNKTVKKTTNKVLLDN